MSRCATTRHICWIELNIDRLYKHTKLRNMPKVVRGTYHLVKYTCRSYETPIYIYEGTSLKYSYQKRISIGGTYRSSYKKNVASQVQRIDFVKECTASSKTTYTDRAMGRIQYSWSLLSD